MNLLLVRQQHLGRLKKLLMLLLFLLSNNIFIQAQYPKPRHQNFTAGVGSGIILLFGDIGNMGKGDHFKLEGSSSVVQDWSVMISLIYGTVSDSDEGTLNAGRGFAYETTLLQPSVHAIYTFLREKGKGYTRKGLIRHLDRWRGDVMGGIAFPYFKVNPSGRFTPEDMTKQQGLAIAIPFGVAIQYGISEKLSVRGELMPQINFSDNLDGYASPYSKSNDFMYLISIALVYNLLK